MRFNPAEVDWEAYDKRLEQQRRDDLSKAQPSHTLEPPPGNRYIECRACGARANTVLEILSYSWLSVTVSAELKASCPKGPGTRIDMEF